MPALETNVATLTDAGHLCIIFMIGCLFHNKRLWPLSIKRYYRHTCGVFIFSIHRASNVGILLLFIQFTIKNTQNSETQISSIFDEKSNGSLKIVFMIIHFDK